MSQKSVKQDILDMARLFDKRWSKFKYISLGVSLSKIFKPLQGCLFFRWGSRYLNRWSSSLSQGPVPWASVQFLEPRVQFLEPGFQFLEPGSSSLSQGSSSLSQGSSSLSQGSSSFSQGSSSLRQVPVPWTRGLAPCPGIQLLEPGFHFLEPGFQFLDPGAQFLELQV